MKPFQLILLYNNFRFIVVFGLLFISSFLKVPSQHFIWAEVWTLNGPFQNLNYFIFQEFWGTLAGFSSNHCPVVWPSFNRALIIRQMAWHLWLTLTTWCPCPEAKRKTFPRILQRALSIFCTRLCSSRAHKGSLLVYMYLVLVRPVASAGGMDVPGVLQYRFFPGDFVLSSSGKNKSFSCFRSLDWQI